MAERCRAWRHCPQGPQPRSGRHSVLDPRLVDENKPCDLDPALMRFPSGPLVGDVLAILLG